MIDVYRFTGEDSSLCYGGSLLGATIVKKGQLYALKTRRGTWWERTFHGWYYVIEAPFFCPYSGMDTFYDNWTLVGITNIEEKPPRLLK